MPERSTFPTGYSITKEDDEYPRREGWPGKSIILPLIFFSSSPLFSSLEEQTKEAMFSFIEVTVSGKAFSVAYENNTLHSQYHVKKRCLSTIARTKKENRITMDGSGSSAACLPEYSDYRTIHAVISYEQ